MGEYARGTDVPPERSRAELERILQKYNADEIYFRSGKDGQSGVVFKMKGTYVRLSVQIPPLDEFAEDSAGRKRSADQAQRAREAEERRLWRVLVLLCKAKFEAIETGVLDFRSEWLAHIVLPDNSTVGEFMEPQITEMYKSGAVPAPYQQLMLGAPK